MSVYEFALWGAFGGLAVDLVQIVGAIRRTGGWPWLQPGEPGPGPLLASVVIRAGLGAGLAAAAGDSGQITGAVLAVGVGAAAPLILEQLIKLALSLFK